MNHSRLLLGLRWLWLAAALLAWIPASAEPVGNLYEAEAPVLGQRADARAVGLRDAFAKVLVKVSGDRGLLNQPDLGRLLNKASGFVQQYRYKSLESPPADAAQATADRLLWVRFDKRAVNRLLRESGVPVWGETRPSILVWLGVEEGTRRGLTSPEHERLLRHRLNRVADTRGLPFMWPLMDIEDRNAIRVSDLWGGFEENIRKASDRYLPDVILVGRMTRRGADSWRGEWLLYLPDKVNRWQTLADTKTALASEGLNQAADALALRFAPQQVSLGVTDLRIRVHGLSQLADYVLVKDYLRSLAIIEQLDLLSASPEKVSFMARVHGGREALERGIQLGAVLEPVAAHEYVVADETGPPEPLVGESLDYRLR
ncbi:MAG: DUF2066 domain-containing protein [Candidatus Thiodiazotropha sp. (ex Dulcina madagascariensis)]|nr:DUF2066 domain-containing protein [Candidatus Thiodiazotropha sp. (ex Dulcina madagascariensis)]